MNVSEIPEETLKRFERWQFVGSDHFEIAALARAELSRRVEAIENRMREGK